jgi:hypothetical protein
MSVTSLANNAKQVTFDPDNAIKLVVDATCVVCGWQGQVNLYSTSPEKIDACDTYCPRCDSVDYIIRIAIDTSAWIGVKGGSA